jgi:hypothetical protein
MELSTVTLHLKTNATVPLARDSHVAMVNVFYQDFDVMESGTTLWKALAT